MGIRRKTNFCVHLEGQHDLGSAVPPSGDVLRHQTDFFPGGDAGLHAASQAKVTNLQVTIGIEKKVSRFEVTVDDVGAVD